VPKVTKTGAGAALLEDRALAVALAQAAARGSGLPVTVKLRSGLRPGDQNGIELARALVLEGGVAGLSIHPRHASQRHSGSPDYELAASLVQELPVPVMLSGGLWGARRATEAFEQTGAAAILIARGGLGNPWLFSELVHGRSEPPSREEIVEELDWVIDQAVDHVGEERATRYLRKFYPWYVARIGGTRAEQKALQQLLQTAPTLLDVRELLAPVPA
jgi:tRNA-dihydrouridine synthase